jgi:hypothetical protein
LCRSTLRETPLSRPSVGQSLAEETEFGISGAPSGWPKIQNAAVDRGELSPNSS